MILDANALAQFESRYRATLINSLAGVKQAFLLGSISKSGVENLAIFNSLIHIGANPPLWGFICRPDTVKRDTLTNILETQFYTINYVAAEDYINAHQTSAKYDADVSEFEACGFEKYYSNGFEAPFVAGAPVKIAMKFEQKIDISLNGTMLIIGRIVHIELDESLVSPDGFVALDKANTLSTIGLDAYCSTHLIERLSYAQPDKWPTKLG